jgi:dTDP-4-amino-4,6-dideoxygalactose transaminase
MNNGAIAPALRRDASRMLHVGKPNVGDRERFKALVDDMLDRRWLTNAGPYVLELEKRLAETLGVRHVMAVCNATIALEIAVHAMDLRGEVIVPSFTFVATSHALHWLGVTPVFADIDARTHMLDSNDVEARITPRTTGIVGVHLWGRTCDVGALDEIAARRGLRLLFDAAHAFGCARGGTMVGNFGAAEVFSFHATKFFNTFEGGAIATNDDTLAARVRLMRNFGFAGHDDVRSEGTNGKMSEVSAAMGLVNLDSVDHFIAVNRRNYERYRTGLSGLQAVRFLEYDAHDRTNYQYVVIEIDEATSKATRDEIMNALWEQGVFARRYFYPGNHRMEPYRSLPEYQGVRLPMTETLVTRTLVLPTGTGVSDADIDFICRFIRAAATGNDE